MVLSKDKKTEDAYGFLPGGGVGEEEEKDDQPYAKLNTDSTYAVPMPRDSDDFTTNMSLV